ncbi:hypothetical protein CAPTEDRAFT_103580 [Capitella teleta]|uniref:SH2 domain-containing protein n=1 Tax=Capitella teleta TaxID=283909 RepID=R7UU49_CAPTE|nr:hypothetical protein CAPTEDRAFT_103580 [Capitella teleta]|eukprot:ELU10034.1 hypothetical protein CAPTEDRAFT_103580 [Capitella teleta]
MLQQILQDMFIDPDLLQELDEEQKQVLFCKMREEQVRRWKEAESKLEKEQVKKDKKKKKSAEEGSLKKKVDFLLGDDGEPWTWLMGEHPDDKSIEEILEEEQQKEAAKLAEQEAEQLRLLWLLEYYSDCNVSSFSVSKRKQNWKRRKKVRGGGEEERGADPVSAFSIQSNWEKIAKSEKQRRVSMHEAKKLRDKRSSQIYDTFKEARRIFIHQKSLFTEIKAKEAELEKRTLARKAREEHRRSLMNTLRTESQIVGMMAMSLKRAREGKENIKPAVTRRDILHLSKPMKGLASKPSNKQDVVTWFKEYEVPKGAGLESKSQKVAPWFHGESFRSDAEALLLNEAVGSYLVRLSEKIWGYAISYRSQDRCKHFLVDASEGSYQFFGTNQLSHASLEDLVNFHKSKAISLIGQEMLHHSVGQTSDPPDYSELISTATIAESSYL